MTRIANDVDKHVGARVLMRRLSLEMSQSKLAEALDVSYQQVQKYEKGANRIGASRLQLLARALEVSPAYFFDGAPSIDESAARSIEPNVSSHSGDFAVSREALRLIRAYAAIRDSEVRRKTLDLIETLATTTH